jgi:hypothetical protein
MNHLLISIDDFPDFLPFSVQIAPLLVEPHIRDAQTFDLWPLLPVTLREVYSQPRADWPAVPTGVSFYQGSVFKPVAGQLGIETVLFTDFVRPLLVCFSGSRMMLWHGLHVTEAGMEVFSDMGRAPISPAQRATLRADVQGKATHYQGLFETALRAAYPIPTTCGRRPRRPVGGGSTMSAV